MAAGLESQGPRRPAPSGPAPRSGQAPPRARHALRQPARHDRRRRRSQPPGERQRRARADRTVRGGFRAQIRRGQRVTRGWHPTSTTIRVASFVDGESVEFDASLPDGRARAGDPRRVARRVTSSAFRGRSTLRCSTRRRSSQAWWSRARRFVTTPTTTYLVEPDWRLRSRGPRRHLVPQELTHCYGDIHEHVDHRAHAHLGVARDRNRTRPTRNGLTGSSTRPPCSWDRRPRSCAATPCSPAPTKRTGCCPARLDAYELDRVRERIDRRPR